MVAASLLFSVVVSLLRSVDSCSEGLQQNTEDMRKLFYSKRFMYLMENGPTPERKARFKYIHTLMDTYVKGSSVEELLELRFVLE